MFLQPNRNDRCLGGSRLIIVPGGTAGTGSRNTDGVPDVLSGTIVLIREGCIVQKKTMRKLGSLTGALTLLSTGAVQAAVEQEAPETYSASVTEREEQKYDTVANVKGEFSFDQNVVTPADEVFNLFGTVATAMCARPGFAFGEVKEEDYFINVGGSVKKTQTISLEELKSQGGQKRVMACSCATGPAVANAQVVGIPLKNIMQMVDVEEQANTLTVTGSDGYGVSMPLTYALNRDAIVVYQVGDKAVPTGVQLWVPKSVARYFARSVVDVEFSAQEKEPEVLQADASQRAKVSVLNSFDNTVFKVGDQIVFEGYADDCDKAITAVEYSMDGGKTWTSFATEGAAAERWVYWHFGYVTEAEGTFRLDVRARAEDGTVSPLASSVVFTVDNAESDRDRA